MRKPLLPIVSEAAINQLHAEWKGKPHIGDGSFASLIGAELEHSQPTLVKFLHTVLGDTESIDNALTMYRLLEIQAEMDNARPN